MTVEPTAIQNGLPPGPRFALNACALALGASRGPILLRSAAPSWEHTLRARVGDQLFSMEDSGRPRARAWVGAVWLEPQCQGWEEDLKILTEQLPGGAALSIVASLPLTMLYRPANPRPLCATPRGLWQIRRGLAQHGFRIERAFGFHTLWWSGLRWTAARLRLWRPDLSDRVHHIMRRRFVVPSVLLPFATAGLFQARAGLQP